MGISEAVVLLAGFVLAHAAWSISDVPVGELLTPLAIREVGGQRHLQRFEAATQEDAIAAGKKAMTEATNRGQAWAFAREGLLNERDRKVDVITIDFWDQGMTSPVTLIQRFRPAGSKEGFAILGDAQISIDGYLQDSTTTATLLAIVRQGIAQHSKAGPLWAEWVAGR